MRIWNSFPMLRVIPPFLIGVVGTAFLTEIIEWNEPLLYLILGGLGVTVLIALVFAANTSNKFRFGLVNWVLMLVLGTFLTLSISNSIFPESIESKLGLEEERTYLIEIVEEPQVKERSVKVVAELTDDSISANSKVLLYFKNDSANENLKYGDVLAVCTKLEKVENLGNPNEFNYKRYLRFHGISYRGYVATGKSEILSTDNPGIWGHFYAIRERLIQKLKDARIDGNELSVASALILGYRADLDKELMSAYAGAGATHVLAVSGLHVGIVYVILNTLLKFMDRRRGSKIFKTILLIILLFGYAGLTGLSASVFRAATMFSFVAVGKAIKRDTNIFNTLAASAFVLIAFDPMIIMQVGFQLSYAAVIGIVLIQPRLFNLISFPQSRLLDQAWAITCVSIAAQIATAPLGLLYFHQFPNFFWVSNLLVIPAAAIILYLGFSLFVFSFWEPTLLFFGFLLKKLISILNQLVIWIEQIPYSVLSGIDISTVEALMIYAMIFGMLLFIIQKVRFGLYAALTIASVFMALQIVEVHEQQRQEFVTIYNIRGETAIGLFNGTSLTFIGSEKLYNDEQAMLFHVRHHWWNKGVETENFVVLDSLYNTQLGWLDIKFTILNPGKTKSEILNASSIKNLDFVLVHALSWKSIPLLSELPTKEIIVGRKFTPKMLAEIEEADGRLLFQEKAIIIK